MYIYLRTNDQRSTYFVETILSGFVRNKLGGVGTAFETGLPNFQKYNFYLRF